MCCWPNCRHKANRTDGGGSRERLRIYGLNLFEAVHREAFLVKLGKRVLNPLVALLIAAAAVSGISGDFGSFFIIVAVLALSMTLDIVQEHRAEQEAEALRHSVAVHADVMRDRKQVAQPVSALVPGDIVLLRTGDLVPADGIVLESDNLQLDESILTGEPFPARKNNAPCTATEAADASNALFAGTSVVAGKATMLLVETGPRTRFGAIASALAANVPPTALEQGVRHLGLLILRLTIFLTLFVLLAHLASDRPAMQSILFAVALAVGLTPELLPMVMTVTLARGAKRMALQKVIVKRLSAIHDLGAMDVLCVDKTGTLTEAKISLADSVDWQGRKSDRVLELARINSHFQTGIRSALDEAILAGQSGGPEWERRGELPFDFSRRCLSVLAEREGEMLLVTKGAPEAVLSRAVAVEVDGLAHPLDDSWRSRLEDEQRRLNEQGFRLIGVAIRSVPADQTGLNASGRGQPDICRLLRFRRSAKARRREGGRRSGGARNQAQGHLGRSGRRRAACGERRGPWRTKHSDRRRDRRSSPMPALRQRLSRSTCSRASIPIKRSASSMRCEDAAMSRVSSATASMMPPRSMPPMSACPSRAQPTWPAPPRT